MSVGQECGAGLAQGLSGGSRQVWAKAGVIWRLDWGWKVLFQAGHSHGWRCSQFTEDLITLPQSPFTGPLECLLSIVLASPEKVIQETGYKLQYLLWNSLGHYTPSFLPYFMGHTDQPWFRVRDDTKACMLEAKHPCRGGIVSWKVATTIKCHICGHNFLIMRRRHIKM